MARILRRLVLAAAMTIPCGVTNAAQQVNPTTQLMVRNPAPSGDMLKRKVIFKSQGGSGSTNTIVGDPVVNGATLHVTLSGGADQCFDLPASGWSPIGLLGFKYKDFDGPGAAISASIKKTTMGVFIIKAKLAGRVGPLDIVPQAATAGFDTNLSLGGGDEYCSGGATPSGSTNTDKVYGVKNVPAPAGCGVSACVPSAALPDRF